MNTEQLQLVTFERAKRLKELGFDWLCDFYYAEKGKYLIERPCNNSAAGMNCKEAPYFAVPTVALTLKWIRDEKKIICFTSAWYTPRGRDKKYKWMWQGRIIIINKHPEETNFYDSYESAESALLDKLLTILEKEKEQ
jgi:hypothetical protein